MKNKIIKIKIIKRITTKKIKRYTKNSNAFKKILKYSIKIIIIIILCCLFYILNNINNYLIKSKAYKQPDISLNKDYQNFTQNTKEEFSILLCIIMKLKWHIYVYGGYMIMLINLLL